MSPQYAKNSHLILEIRKEIEKSVLVRQLKAQMTALRATISEKDAQIESMQNNLSSTTLLELSAENEEYVNEISRLTNIISQKDEALVQARREAMWNHQEIQENETGDHLRHELDRLTRGYEEVLHRLEIKNAASSAAAGHQVSNDLASVKSSGSRKRGAGKGGQRPHSTSGSSRPGSSRSGKAGKSSGGSKHTKATVDSDKNMQKVSSLNQLDPELTTFNQQFEGQKDTAKEYPPARRSPEPLTNINNEGSISKPLKDTDLDDISNRSTDIVDDIPNGGKMKIVADAMDGNMSQVMGGLPPGCKVTANYRGEGEYYKGTIVCYHESDGTYDIEFDDGDMEAHVRRDNINVIGEPPKQNDDSLENSTRQKQKQPESVTFEFPEGTRVDLISGSGDSDDKIMTGTVIKVHSDGKEFDVELDNGDIQHRVQGGRLHKSLLLANKLHTLDEKHNVTKFAVGEKVEACYRGESKWYPGVVSKVRAEGFDIEYNDGEKEFNVKEDLIRAIVVPVVETKPKEARRKTVTRKFRIGQRVEGNYRGQGKWFAGEISKVRTDGFDINYDDGEKEYNVKDDLIRAEVKVQEVYDEVNNLEPNKATGKKFSVGDRVEARYRGKSKWYPGNVGKIRSEGYDIEYDDGEKEYNVSEDLIRSLGDPGSKAQIDSDSRSNLKVGDKVEARYKRKSRWYPGVVCRVRSEGYDVDYDDGEQEINVQEDCIRRIVASGNVQHQDDVVLSKYAVGDKVEARYRGKSKWYPGVIGKVRSEGYDVEYDDGEKEYNVNEEFIRLLSESQDAMNRNDFQQTDESFRTTSESQQDDIKPPSGNTNKPKKQLATNDDLNDFLNGLGSDDDSELPDYGGLPTQDEGEGYDYGEDFED